MTRSRDNYPTNHSEQESAPKLIERVRKFGRGILGGTRRLEEDSPSFPRSETEPVTIDHIREEPTSEVYQVLEGMIGLVDSPIATRYTEQLYNTINQLPNHAAILAHETALGDNYKLRMDAPAAELDQIDRQTVLLYEERDSRFDAAEYKEVTDINNQLRALETMKITLPTDNPDARAILDLINQAPSLDRHEAAEAAPFANYKTNTNEAWTYIPSDDIRQFLDKKTFIPGTEKARDYGAGYSVAIDQLEEDAQKKTPIAIPSRIIVNAAGFDSWQGRGFDGQDEKSITSFYTKDNPRERYTSHTALKHYASLPSELPPVDIMNVYVQPDGKIFADNDGGDSHRIAAALLRGDEFINAQSVTVRLLSQNVIDL